LFCVFCKLLLARSTLVVFAAPPIADTTENAPVYEKVFSSIGFDQSKFDARYA